ncbi:ATP-binding cassette domain-containing protein [Anaerocolumna sedimenticola]|uniref:ATP-binding cassette domain-containing protein n=1 Tax=Anaerocolumna sedimenticola TaxID=2696063 RepID=A0A6P1TKA0_9FIRM|nr:ABC transporter ATP-binding protein [Anaerocolumna sedimenticola]QHQ61630.1 ATP-binding cassette domain-containing protein [Anaerocolumna sedimenticola]
MEKNILIDFIKKHKHSYIIGLLFMFLSSYVQTLFPKVLGNNVDILKIKGFQGDRVYSNIGYILLIAAGTFAFTYIWRNLVIGNARKLECHLREILFDHFQILTPEFYSKRKTGDLIAYAINDINAVRQTLGPALSMAINGIVVCVISIYSMSRAVNWQLTLLSLLPVPVMVYIMIYIGGLVKKRFKRVQETFAAISDRVNENINGMRVIKAYVQEDKEVEKFEKLNNQMVETNLNMIHVSAFLAPLIEICFTVSFVFNLIWGGNMVLKGSISLGDFIAFNGYLTMILAPVLSIGQVTTIFQRGMASFNRLNEILCVKPQVKNDGTICDLPKALIKINNLSFTYPGAKKESLRNINLTIPKGHTLGIIGKTGSGKSTLIHLLLKLYNVENNCIYYGDADINKFKLEAIKNGIGLVPQDNFLFHASISDNIRFFKDIYTEEAVEEAARNSCIYENIIDLPDQFNTILGERGVNISGGQKQRISIARALVRNPDILVLDDALSAVDTVTESRILNNLRRLRRNKTTIIVASRISAVMQADEILVLDKGEIKERGTHTQLIKKGGIYNEIYQYQFGTGNFGTDS